MDLTIQSEKPLTGVEWDEIWGNCDYATYFQSREWALIWKKYTYGRMKPQGTKIVFSDRTSALLPFTRQSILMGFFNRMISSPAGTYGGWISTDNLSMAHGSLLYEYIITTCQDLLWRLNPYDPIITSVKVDVFRQDTTQALGLARGFDAIYKTWTKGHASAARKAQREGVKIIKADSIMDWLDYYNIYKDSVVRWGKAATSFYGWSLFKSMYEASSSNIKLWLASYQGKIVSGALCFYAKRHVVYWHGASFPDFYKLRPANLLLSEIILDACDRGYQWFDFNPSGGHEGVVNFKKSFGTQNLSCPIIVNTSKSLMFLKRMMGRKGLN